jgi:hypothetical protein
MADTCCEGIRPEGIPDTPTDTLNVRVFLCYAMKQGDTTESPIFIV